MKALVIDPPGKAQLRQIELPPLARGECRVAVRLAAVCRTDLELLKGYLNFSGVPGHEFVGTVVQGAQRLLGRRVVGEINAGCGDCQVCREGLARHCPQRTVLGIYQRSGAFAEFLDLPEQNLLTVPDSVGDEEAVFVEPLAAALEIFEQIHIKPGARVLVLGDGKLGLLIAQVCAQRGLKVTLFGRHEKKLALARRWGVAALQAGDDSPRSAERYAFVVECTGSPAGFATALKWTAPRGMLVLKSTYAPQQVPSVDWSKIVVDEITLLGSRCGALAPALRLLAQGQFDVRALIDHRKTLDQAAEAFELAAQRGVLKVLVSIKP